MVQKFFLVILLSSTVCRAAQIDSMVLLVNDEPKLVRKDQVLKVVKGDVVKVTVANFTGEQQAISAINFIGFPNRSETKPADDRSYPIHTDRDLLKWWSVDRKGLRYRVEARQGKEPLGQIFVEVHEPELMYAIIELNGKEVVIRPQEKIRVHENDQFQIKRAVTNLEEIDEDIRFKIRTLRAESGPVPVEFYEIQFARRSQIFARIPLEVEVATVQ